MSGFMRVLRVELRKTRWPLTLGIVIVPALLVVLATGPADPELEFSMYYTSSVVMYGWLFYPILAGILAGLVCRVDHATGGWKQLLALPIRRWHLYLAKYSIVAGLLALSQLLLVAFIAASAAMAGVTAVYDWSTVWSGLVFGWVAVLPLAALQLWASSRWRAFGGPLALNVVLTLPALFTVQSEQYGPWYPWGQPVLAMLLPAQDSFMPISTETLVYVVGAGFVAWLAAGLYHFARADVPG